MLGRRAIGIDRDPLALLVSNVKLSKHDTASAKKVVERALQKAEAILYTNDAQILRNQILQESSPRTVEFIDYWFFPQTQVQLWTLASAIKEEPVQQARNLLKVIFSSIIVTKAGGVSRAKDLAHTRPHLDPKKPAKDVLVEYAKRASRVIGFLEHDPDTAAPGAACYGDARNLPIRSSSVDLVVTSPPYANAIDYMRAHKFSLVWMGYPIEELSILRGQYIGSERENGNVRWTPKFGQVAKRESRS